MIHKPSLLAKTENFKPDLKTPTCYNYPTNFFNHLEWCYLFLFWRFIRIIETNEYARKSTTPNHTDIQIPGNPVCLKSHPFRHTKMLVDLSITSQLLHSLENTIQWSQHFQAVKWHVKPHCSLTGSRTTCIKALPSGRQCSLLSIFKLSRSCI